MPAASQTIPGTAWFLAECAETGQGVRVIAVSHVPFLVGRSPEAALCLPTTAVSKQHAELLFDGGTLVVRDLGSTNGTFVNRQRVTDMAALHDGDLLQFSTEAFRVQRGKPEVHLRTVANGSFEMVQAMCQFDQLMSDKAVTPHFQAIVDLQSGGIVAYEVLARSTLKALENPGAMFMAAARLGQEAALSVMLREEGVRVGQQLPGSPELYLNTHPKELVTPELLKSLEELRKQAPHQPLTLEVHEAGVTDAEQMIELRAVLTELDMRLAYDDFGAGQARLDELARVAPDCVKFDMKLVRGLHEATPERRMVTARMVDLVRDLDITPLAEGVECEAEADACEEIGFELAQGFYFSRPLPVSAAAQLADGETLPRQTTRS
jgi:EAL domain-containing protein (putative c-di-GMP-specific phosphodiesterase class I)